MYNIKSENLIEGKNVILETINSNKTIRKIFLLKGFKDKAILDKLDNLKNKGTIINYLEKNEFDKISLNSKSQGIIAEIEEYQYTTVDEILEYAKERNEKPFLLIIDGITDPHNFGAIIRAAVAVGVHGIIIKSREQCIVNDTVYKTSAGLVNFIKIAKVVNISKTIEMLKTFGMWFYGASMEGENIYKTNFNDSIALVIGAEGSGISRLVKENCDMLVSIPMDEKVNSLNASVSTGIILYEIKRKISLI